MNRSSTLNSVDSNDFESASFSRRVALRRMIKAALLPAGMAAAPLVAEAWQAPAPPPDPRNRALSSEDEAFLEELEKANFLFFWEQGDSETGLVKDRCSVRAADKTVVASV